MSLQRPCRVNWLHWTPSFSQVPGSLHFIAYPQPLQPLPTFYVPPWAIADPAFLAGGAQQMEQRHTAGLAAGRARPWNQLAM